MSGPAYVELLAAERVLGKSELQEYLSADPASVAFYDPVSARHKTQRELGRDSKHLYVYVAQLWAV